jgi:hypothetical protein
MEWVDLKKKIYYWDGSWRDIYILETTLEDNKKWADYVNDKYLVERRRPLPQWQVVVAVQMSKNDVSRLSMGDFRVF